MSVKSEDSGPVVVYDSDETANHLRPYQAASIVEEGLMPEPLLDLPGQLVTEPPRRDTTEMPVLVERGEHDTEDFESEARPGSTSDGNSTLASADVLELKQADMVDRYRIIKQLGRGAMAAVYEAEHVHIGRRVALKVLHPDAADGTVARFFDEARVVNRVRHPSIIDVHDLVYRPGRPTYLVMELLHGRDLASELSAEGSLPPPRVIDIGAQVASALAALHRARMVHRDLKPPNIFICDPGTDGPLVRLIDFGVARVLERDSTVNHAETMHGSIIGTIDYMSPEQALGEPAGPSSDVWALGVVLHEMATGRRPFIASNLAELLFAFTSQPPDAKDVKPSALRKLILSCLSGDPTERPTMTAAENALRKMKPRVPLVG